MSILGNLFSFKNADGKLNKQTIVGWATGFIAVLATVPGGPELIQGGLAAMGKYAPVAIALFSFLGGAAANTKPE